jgi:LytS/YehU family sensor histidine kinase
VPAELMSLPLPPMLLQPVVENAIKHGLEPTIGGGEVIVSARRVGEQIVLVVRDDGMGVRAVRPEGSTGVGLANLRERLATLYGALGRLTIEDGEPGTMVTISLPVTASR